MNASDILKQCGGIATEGGQDISEDYVERVFYAKDIGQWEHALTQLLGPAVKKSGEATTKAFHDLTVKYGGVLDNQTLFYKKLENNSIIAMFWPWRDKNQVTLKIASFKE